MQCQLAIAAIVQQEVNLDFLLSYKIMNVSSLHLFSR